MTAYEQPVLNSQQYYNHAIDLAEAEDQEIFASYVPADLLHEIMHNPIQEGIDEG